MTSVIDFLPTGGATLPSVDPGQVFGGGVTGINPNAGGTTKKKGWFDKILGGFDKLSSRANDGIDILDRFRNKNKEESPFLPVDDKKDDPPKDNTLLYAGIFFGGTILLLVVLKIFKII